jgi:hypothetical protein
MRTTAKRNRYLETITSTYHYRFIRYVTQNAIASLGRKFRMHKYLRPLRIEKVDDEFTNIVNADDRLITPTIKLHPESVAFLFHLNGCAKNLAFYIVMLELNHNTGEYYFNALIKERFKAYAESLFGEKYKPDTINQAHRDLVNSNLVLNISTHLYLVNPLFAGGGSDAGRILLTKKYTELLKLKSKDALTGIYPKYFKNN